MVTVETATVYRAENGRRYFTKRGACRATARTRIAQKYGCCCLDPEYAEVGGTYQPIFAGYTCPWHRGDLNKLVDRYARLLMRQLAKGAG